MSPKVLAIGDKIVWFHSFDIFENRASVHIGKGSQDDYNDAKIWLEPEIAVARAGKTLRPHELRQIVRDLADHREFLLEAWNEYRQQAGR